MTDSFGWLQALPQFNRVRTKYDLQIRRVDGCDDDPVSAWRAINRSVIDVYRDGLLPIVMNGDHSQAVGSVSAAKQVYRDAGLLWIDAHADIHTPQSSQSRNLHGMPLAFLSQQLDTSVLQGAGQFKCIDLESDLIYYGVRSIDPAERVVLNDYKIPRLAAVNRNIISNLDKRHLWVSLDVDALDPSQFNSTQTKEQEGLSQFETDRVLRLAMESIIGMDITEVDVHAAASS